MMCDIIYMYNLRACSKMMHNNIEDTHTNTPTYLHESSKVTSTSYTLLC